MHSSITTLVTGMQAPVTFPAISHAGNSRHHEFMEDIYSIRRSNLRRLCAEKCEGNQSEMGRQLGVEPNLINRYLRNKPIGPEFARGVEKKYKLETGWMDRMHQTDIESAVIEAFRKANEDRKKSVMLLLEVPAEEAVAGLKRIPSR